MMKTAVLLTCFNRRDITVKCLKQLFELNINMEVFLVDDLSTDGTRAAVERLYPAVNIIQGNGNLFWNRGMHLAWKSALRKGEFDYYLLLNDDVFLYENSFEEIFYCSEIMHDNAIISGVIESEEGEILYGGYNKDKQVVKPNGTIENIIFMNGNFVLVPNSVCKMIGIIDPYYHHDLGDVDYGLRAKKSGIKVVTTRVAIGRGIKNEFCRVRFWGGDLKKRFKKLYSPLGNHPGINFYFRRRHFGYFNAIRYYLFIHFLNVIPDSFTRLLFGTRYMNR